MAETSNCWRGGFRSFKWQMLTQVDRFLTILLKSTLVPTKFGLFKTDDTTVVDWVCPCISAFSRFRVRVTAVGCCKHPTESSILNISFQSRMFTVACTASWQWLQPLDILNFYHKTKLVFTPIQLDFWWSALLTKTSCGTLTSVFMEIQSFRLGLAHLTSLWHWLPRQKKNVVFTLKVSGFVLPQRSYKGPIWWSFTRNHPCWLQTSLKHKQHTSFLPTPSNHETQSQSIHLCVYSLNVTVRSTVLWGLRWQISSRRPQLPLLLVTISKMTSVRTSHMNGDLHSQSINIRIN